MYKSIVLSVVLHGSETWILTWKEGHGLEVSEKMVKGRISGPKRNEWQELLNKELHDMYSSSNIIRVIKPRRIRRVGHTPDTQEITQWWNSWFYKITGNFLTTWVTINFTWRTQLHGAWYSITQQVWKDESLQDESSFLCSNKIVIQKYVHISLTSKTVVPKIWCMPLWEGMKGFCAGWGVWSVNKKVNFNIKFSWITLFLLSHTCTEKVLWSCCKFLLKNI
jgi:hypothetical protein